MKGILGRKVGMTQVFSKDGKLIPVTVISVPENTVMQIKAVETDGYNAIQLGVVDKKEKNASRASVGEYCLVQNGTIFKGRSTVFKCSNSCSKSILP